MTSTSKFHMNLDVESLYSPREVAVPCHLKRYLSQTTNRFKAQVSNISKKRLESTETILHLCWEKVLKLDFTLNEKKVV